MKNLIDYASQDNGTDFRDALYSAIHDKVAAHIEAKKQEIASGLMGQNEAKEDREDEEHYRSRRAKDEKAVPSEESPEEKMARKKLNKEEYESLDEIASEHYAYSLKDSGILGTHAQVYSRTDKTSPWSKHANHLSNTGGDKGRRNIEQILKKKYGSSIQYHHPSHFADAGE